MAATEEPLVVNRQEIPFTLDGGVAPRAAIGLIVLATDHTIEHEWRRILRDVEGVGVFETRIWNDAQINSETLAQMEARITDCTAVIRPGERIDVVGYACTSGAMVIGAGRRRRARPRGASRDSRDEPVHGRPDGAAAARRRADRAAHAVRRRGQPAHARRSSSARASPCP